MFSQHTDRTTATPYLPSPCNECPCLHGRRTKRQMEEQVRGGVLRGPIRWRRAPAAGKNPEGCWTVTTKRAIADIQLVKPLRDFRGLSCRKFLTTTASRGKNCEKKWQLQHRIDPRRFYLAGDIIISELIARNCPTRAQRDAYSPTPALKING